MRHRAFYCHWYFLVSALLALVLLSACAGPSPSPTEGELILVNPPLTSVATATPELKPTATTTATPLPTATPVPTVDPMVALRQVKANELGYIMVLEYHLIEAPEDRWSRTPDNFRADIERLIQGGYYPINLADFATGNIDVPAGKTPVVLTFDDSSSSQCRLLDDGSPDPDSACGILLDMARQYPDDWRPSGSFYVLLDVDVPDRVVFGQPDIAEKKLQQMVEWGFEIGSHTISHFNLALGEPDTIRWQLADSAARLEKMIPGYKVKTLSIPLGEYPADESLIHSGEWEGEAYNFVAALEVAGGCSDSPFSANFDPYHIARIQGLTDELNYWFSYFEENPELRYISDGDPAVVAVPETLPEKLAGTLRTDLPDGARLVKYTGGQ